MTTKDSRTLHTPQAMNAAIKSICDILRRSGSAGALAYVPELSYLLFLRILDVREEEEAAGAAAVGDTFVPSLDYPYRWRDWASKIGKKRRELKEVENKDVRDWLNLELLPMLHALKDRPHASPRQKIIAEALSGVKATQVDSENNLLTVLDKIDEIHPDTMDKTQMFALSQVYEGLLLKMGEKGNDGGQFYTPREVIRAMVKVVEPRLGERVYDPCAGTGGFLAETCEYLKQELDRTYTPERYETLTRHTFYGREKEKVVYPITLSNLVLHGIDEPHIWHGNTLTQSGGYGGLFENAPNQYEIILTNPPFGGKEGQDAQTEFPYKTGATQILFLQHIMSSLKPGGRCGLVIDEGSLFRTNETAFVQTKRKLLEEYDLWCIVSLPGGVFTGAGAGVKTNLLFFTKGHPTERIWYYDLSGLKIGKTTPLMGTHFEEFFRLLPERENSEKSWTIDLQERRREAAARSAPLKVKARVLLDSSLALTDKARLLKRNESQRKEMQRLEAEADTLKKEATQLTSQAQTIDDAVYDLKAVNPHIAEGEAPATPEALVAEIAVQSERLSAALAKLVAIA